MLFKRISQCHKTCQKYIQIQMNFVKQQYLLHIHKRINAFLASYIFKPEHIQGLHNKRIQVFIFNQHITWQFLANIHTLSIDCLNIYHNDDDDDSNSNINDNKSADLNIYASIKNLLSLNKLNIDNILSKIKIEGDVHIASSLSKIIQHMHIDLENILGIYLPKKTAYILAQVLHKLFSQTQNVQKNLFNHTSHYLTDKNYLISSIEFGSLEQNIRNLRDDVERLEQKIQQIKHNQIIKRHS